MAHWAPTDVVKCAYCIRHIVDPFNCLYGNRKTIEKNGYFRNWRNAVMVREPNPIRVLMEINKQTWIGMIDIVVDKLEWMGECVIRLTVDMDVVLKQPQNAVVASIRRRTAMPFSLKLANYFIQQTNKIACVCYGLSLLSAIKRTNCYVLYTICDSRVSARVYNAGIELGCKLVHVRSN